VLGNLLSNAIKFTPAGGRVVLSLGEDGGAARVSVEDDGNGVAPEFLPHLFQPFRQADSSTTRAHKGLGIGLAIVRQLVELHGGSVRAESGGEGRGARFTLCLPLAEPSLTAADPARPAETRGRERLDGVRVLVVEDDPDTRDGLVHALELHGADVVAVDSCARGLEALDRGRFDVLLSDLGMPGEDGFSLIRRVRARAPERGGRLPAVALSAYARADERARALLAGFDAHVAKPVEPAALAAAVLQAASRSDA
jgi:CheY-like chemotaxis protein